MNTGKFALCIAVLSSCAPGIVQAAGLAWSQRDSKRLSMALEDGRYGQISSVLIEHDGKIVLEAYFDGADAATRHNMRSAGKTVTGMLLGAAIGDGLIGGVGTRAAGYFDELRPFPHPDARKDDITLDDLLTMSGPLECDDWNSFSRGNEERMYLVEDWSAFFWSLPIKNRPSWEIPDDDGGFGRLFTYCTAGVQLLGEIVERAVGEPAPAYAARRLFAPIGVDNPKWNLAATGKAHLGGGLELTTRDWARVARLYLDRGRAQQEQVLPESWIDASLADYVKIDDNTNYGYLWWRPRYEVGGESFTASVMSGSGGNRVWLLPEFGVVVVMTKTDFRDRQAHEKSDRFFSSEIVPRLRAD